MGIPALTQVINLTANGDSFNSADADADEGVAASGGDADLTWSAPNGRANRETITVTSATIDFGTAPRYISLGFGRDWLDSNPVGTKLVTHTDTSSGDEWLYEFAVGTSKRVVSMELGFKSLVSEAAAEIGAGYINWDAGDGAALADDTPIFYSSWTRASAQELSNGAPESQWKTYRTCHSSNPASDDLGNSGYHKIFASASNLADDDAGEYTRTNSGVGNVTIYGLTHPTFDNKLTRHDMVIYSGVEDTATGVLLTSDIKPADETGFVSTITENIQFYYPSSTNRFQWMVVQDFAQHLVSGKIHRTDFYWQVGTLKRFELANGATPETSTDSKILPSNSWASGEVELHMWGQSYSNNLNKYLHYYDDDGEFVAGVAL